MTSVFSGNEGKRLGTELARRWRKKTSLALHSCPSLGLHFSNSTSSLQRLISLTVPGPVYLIRWVRQRECCRVKDKCLSFLFPTGSHFKFFWFASSGYLCGILFLRGKKTVLKLLHKQTPIEGVKRALLVGISYYIITSMQKLHYFGNYSQWRWNGVSPRGFFLFFQPCPQRLSQKHDKHGDSCTLTHFIWLIQISRLGRIADDMTYVFWFFWEAHLRL